MATTYEPIATTTLGTAASTIDFTSIASSWTDLKVVLVANSTTAGASPYCRFNSNTSGYSSLYMSGNGTAASSSSTTAQSYIMTGNTVSTSTSVPLFVTVDIFSYAGSTYKTVIYTTSNDQNGSGTVERGTGMWQNTAAITSVRVALSGSTMAAGTTATLYGIKAA